MKNGGLILWNAIACLRHVQDLLSEGTTPYERRFGEPFKVPIIPFGAIVDNHPISAREVNQ